MQLTVVICTHNRSALLERLLRSLAETRQPQGLQIDLLVIANACKDETLTTLAALEPHLNRPQMRLRWAQEPIPGKSQALNHAIGLLEDATDAVAFLDDDQRPNATFFEALKTTFDEYPQVSLFCGRLVPDWDGTEPDWVHDDGPYRIFPPPITIFDAGDESHFLTIDDQLPGGGNIYMRLPLLRRLGEFSTRLGPQGHNYAGGEDVEFQRRALALGEPFLYQPEIQQRHHVDPRRLRLLDLMRMSFQRTCASTRIRARDDDGIPRYMWRKLLDYGLRALFSVRFARRRFYCIRVAATLGEIRGLTSAETDYKAP